ncbi:hypothetical protein ACFL5V_07110 [Fibrobacterota bacterium]
MPFDYFRNFLLDEVREAAALSQCRYYADELMGSLDYSNRAMFQSVIKKAQCACSVMKIPLRHHFLPVYFSSSQGVYINFRLSGLACRLIVMNADPQFPAVARAQAYMAGMFPEKQKRES